MDCYTVLDEVFNVSVEYVWHKETDLSTYDCIILPGGFSYGDYLRCGAIARFSPVMESLIKFARSGGLVFGICNGFQILCESGLLPGSLIRNAHLQFRCEWTNLRVENASSRFTNTTSNGQVLRIPISHGEGNYYADADTVRALEEHRQIVFRYTAPDGTRGEQWNVNGSVEAIAGVCNRDRNVVGLMPHPERACEELVGSVDGRVVLESVVSVLESPRVAPVGSS